MATPAEILHALGFRKGPVASALHFSRQDVHGALAYLWAEDEPTPEAAEAIAHRLVDAMLTGAVPLNETVVTKSGRSKGLAEDATLERNPGREADLMRTFGELSPPTSPRPVTQPGASQNQYGDVQAMLGRKVEADPVEYSGLTVSALPQPVLPEGASRLIIPDYLDFDLDLSYFSWFHGKISTSDATTILADAPWGAFLVRCSRRERSFAIAWKSEDKQKVVHILISAAEVDGRSGYLVEGNKKLWMHIPDIVDAWGRKHLKVAVSTDGAPIKDPELAKVRESQ
jgi:hypothetical protein